MEISVNFSKAGKLIEYLVKPVRDLVELDQPQPKDKGARKETTGFIASKLVQLRIQR